MRKDVFISYSSLDKSLAMKICDYLEKNDIGCFIAPRDLEPGKTYGEEIVKGIDTSRMILLLASKSAMQSQHVLREVERGVNRKLPLLVYKTEEYDIPKTFEYFIMVCQWIDATENDMFSELPQIVRANLNEVSPAKEVSSLEDQTPAKTSKSMLFIGIAVFLLVILALSFGLWNANVSRANNSTSENSSQSEIASESTVNLKLVETKISNLQPGDTVSCGSYNGAPIEWVVLRADDDGTRYLISKDILTLKAYDSAESGKWNYFDEELPFEHDQADTYSDEDYIKAKGSNVWETSNIRTWLNSNEIKVTYADNAPNMKSVYCDDCAYDKEAGFLTNFTDEEQSLLVEQGEDLVSLPTKEDVETLIVNGNIMFAPAKVTAAAIKADTSGESKSLAEQYQGYYPYLTRTADPETSYKVVAVLGADYTDSGSEFCTMLASGSWGIRPVIIVR